MPSALAFLLAGATGRRQRGGTQASRPDRPSYRQRLPGQAAKHPKRGHNMRKVKVKWILRAAITALWAALFAAFQTVAAQAITNTPICQTNQMTGQIDCGTGSDILWGLGITLAILVVGFIWKLGR